MKILKSGYTTGSCSAAGVKASLEFLLNGKCEKNVCINSLTGEKINIPIKKLRKRKNFCTAVVEKYSGDDPDITNGIDICVKVSIKEKFSDIKRGYRFNNIFIYGGRGVGIATKKGLQCPVGKSAINPGPLKMIVDTIDNILDDKNLNIEVMIYIPAGREKAKKTFNEKLGVIGGLSILGSTGILKPMSEEALKTSLYTELKVLKENKNTDWVIFSFGNHGKKYCLNHGFGDEHIVLISNYVGFMLDCAFDLGFKKIIFVGHIGKAIKIAGGIYNTHSKIADGRMEIMGANAFLFGEKNENVRKILCSSTVEEACEYIENREFFNMLADKISFKCKEYLKDENIKCETLIFSFNGDELGHSKEFYKLLEEVKNED